MILPFLFALLTVEAVYGDAKEMRVTIKRIKGDDKGDDKEMNVTIKRVKSDDGAGEGAEMTLTVTREKAKAATDNEMTLTITREKAKAATDNEMTLTITREKAKAITDNEMTLTITREKAKAITDNEMTLTITREKAKAITDNEMTLTITREKAKTATDNEMTLMITREKAKAAADNEMTLTITREKSKTTDNEMTLTITREKVKTADNEMTLTITREKAGGEEPGMLEVIVTREKSKLLEVIVTRKEPVIPKDRIILSSMTLGTGDDGRGYSGGHIAGDSLAYKVLGVPMSVGYKVEAQYMLEKSVECKYFIKRDKDGKPVYGRSRTNKIGQVDHAKVEELSKGLVPQVSGGRVDTKKRQIFANKGAKELTVSLTAKGATGSKAIEGKNPCGGSKIVTDSIFATKPIRKVKIKAEYKFDVVSVEGLEVIEVPVDVDAPAERTVIDGESYDMLLGSKMMLKPVVHYRVGDEKKSTSDFKGLKIKVNGDAVSAADKGGMVIVNAVKTTNARLTLTLMDEKGEVRFQKLIKFHVEKFDSGYEFLGRIKEKPVYQQWDDGKIISGEYYLPAGDVVVYRIKAEGGVKMVKYNIEWSDGSITPFKFTDSNWLVSEKRVVFTGGYGTQSPIVNMTAQLVRASGQGRLTYLNYRYQFQHTLVPTWPIVEEISFSPVGQALSFPMELAHTTIQPLLLTVKYKDGMEKKIVARSYLGSADDYEEMLKNSPLEKHIEYSRSGSSGVGIYGKDLSPSHCTYHCFLEEGEEGTATFTATIKTNEKAGLFVNGGKLTAKAEVELYTTRPPSIKEITVDGPFTPGSSVNVFAEIEDLDTSMSEVELNKKYEVIWLANPPIAGDLESEKSPIVIESDTFIARNKFRVSGTAKTLVDVGVNVGINIKLIEKEDREEQ